MHLRKKIDAVIPFPERYQALHIDGAGFGIDLQLAFRADKTSAGGQGPMRAAAASRTWSSLIEANRKEMSQTAFVVRKSLKKIVDTEFARRGGNRFCLRGMHWEAFWM